MSDISSEFELLSLHYSEADRPSEEPSLVGLTIDSGVTDALLGTEEPRATVQSSTTSQGVTVERFFEECYDAGVKVFPKSDFEKEAFIGAGATMEVYRGRWKSRGQAVAMKYFKTPVWSRLVDSGARDKNYHRLLEACMLELRVLTADHVKRHENIAKVVGVSWHPSGNGICPILIMELACEEHPTLKEFLRLSSPINARLELLRDVLEGLSVIHGLDVVHGDIKPENILVFKSSTATGLVARLSDFGFCRPTVDYKWGAGGTPYWNAPECLADPLTAPNAAAFAVERDFYSLGLLIFHVVTGDMPFASSTPDEIAKMKQSDEVKVAIKEKLVKWVSVNSPASGTNHEAASTGAGSHTLSLKHLNALIDIVSRMLSLRPGDRPLMGEIRTAMSCCTTHREETPRASREKSDKLKFAISLLDFRYSHGQDGVGDIGGHRNLDSSLPPDLQFALYDSLLRAANTGTNQEKAKAMNRLGVFFLNGFGTAKSFKQALEWFCKAAAHGSIEARKMAFRMERATHTLPEQVEANISSVSRAAWMIDTLMDTTKAAGVNPRMVPDGMDVDATTEKIRQVLTSMDPDVTRHGLIRDVEHNIIRIMAYSPMVDQSRLETRKSIQIDAKSSVQLSSAFEFTYEDNADALDQLITMTAIPKAFLDRLVTTAADYGRRRVLRTLCIKHGADPDHIDKQSGRDTPPLVVAGLGNDYFTVMTLLDCGANATNLVMATRPIVNHGASSIMDMILQMIQVQAAREFLDGLQPAINGTSYKRSDIPPDNQNPPPLFFAVLLNRLDKVYALLVRGASPNIRFAGWTAMHLAVRMLHPTALLFLLAFGGDPNARSSIDGYTTLLHTLSDTRMRLPEDSPGADVGSVDFLNRKYRPLPVRTGDVELVQRQALIVRILLDCGAKPSAHCIDGFTPLMTSVVTRSADAKVLTDVMLQAKVPLDDRSSRGETILHFCVMAEDNLRLESFLDAGAKSLINAKDMSSCTPLFVACLQGSSRAVKILLDKGADVTERGVGNMSTFDVAFLTNDWIVIDALYTAASSLSPAAIIRLFSQVDNEGRNAFHYCLASQDYVASNHWLQSLISIMPYHVAGALAEQSDNKHFTPYAIALTKGNSVACAILSSIGSSFAGLPITRLVLPSIQDVREQKENRMRDGDAATESILEECEYTGPRKTLEIAERRQQAELDESILLEGEDSPEAIWRMNTLGTVFERYGRLRKAQEVYHRAWTKALRVLRPHSLLSQDLAAKIVRVLRDRGVEGAELPQVVSWHAIHGKDTLQEGIRFFSEMTVSKAVAGPRPVSGSNSDEELFKPHRCARPECGQQSTIVCEGCRFVRYCSEACRIQDIIDPKIQHHQACMAVESVEESVAVRIEYKDVLHPSSRTFVQREWDRIRRAMVGTPPEIAPSISRLACGFITPRLFQKPLVLQIPKNSMGMFMNSHLFDVKLDLRAASQWSKGGTALAIKDGMHAVIRPIEAAVQAADPNEEISIWFEMALDVDFSIYFPSP